MNARHPQLNPIHTTTTNFRICTIHTTYIHASIILQPDIRSNLPTLEPNHLPPLPNPNPHMRKSTKLKFASEGLANRFVPDGPEAPINRQSRSLRKTRRHGE